MKIEQVTVLSGKGGAGKTSVTAALAEKQQGVIIVDADVNASNLPILLPGQPVQKEPFWGPDKPRIDASLCTGCNLCVEACAFDVIQPTGKAPEIGLDCEGCTACAITCPAGAIQLQPVQSGWLYQSLTAQGWMCHADLFPGDDNSGKLITSVRKQAVDRAREEQVPRILIDGPPGTSCQAISSMVGAKQVLVVVEESLSGLSDYRRLATLIGKMKLPHGVIVNKSGLQPALTQTIRAEIASFKGDWLGVIPFDEQIPLWLAQGKTLCGLPEVAPLLARVQQWLWHRAS